MHRAGRPRAAAPSFAIAAAIALLLLIILSVALQPPRGDGDTLQQALGWARAAFFSAAACAFVLGLAVFLRSSNDPVRPVHPPARSPYLRSRPEPRGTFTLVALGGTPDDTRAIADVADARAAVALLRQWAREHPDEHIVIFDPDGEPVAFHRPAAVGRARRRGAA